MQKAEGSKEIWKGNWGVKAWSSGWHGHWKKWSMQDNDIVPAITTVIQEWQREDGDSPFPDLIYLF